MTVNATSPASSGPAGPLSEGQVGAYYLLSMLTGTEPRGLPGTTIDRIEFQRAAEGRPLDDVIVIGHDTLGKSAVLEIQVKRTIRFTPTDTVFAKVAGQIATASGKPEFWASRYELAIAAARTSHKIDGAYQDVLTWARQLGDAETFMDRIDRKGSANPAMRAFVSTFKSHLCKAGSPDDDQTVWQLLRRLKILIFDFTAQGSASEALARERAVHALHTDDSVQAGSLWTTLVEFAIEVAASGGDCTRDGLIEHLGNLSFRLARQRRYSSTRAALAEASRNALADIGDRIGGVMLTRHERLTAVHAALDKGRYVEVRGDAGVGKSGVLKHFAEQLATESQVVVLSPGRTTPGGWTAMRAVLGFDGAAHDLLVDLSGNGGAILFIDNLDFFSDEERRTVVDLVREAADIPGLSVVATARRNFGVEEPNWLPQDAIDRLGHSEPQMIGQLSETEVDELRHAAPKLAPLLTANHPARDVTRNLFRLARLARRPEDEPVPSTEVDMAKQWWQTADGKHDSALRDRARLLKALAEQALSNTGPMDANDSPARAVDALVASETLRDLGNDRVVFRHDVLREWAIGNLLDSEPAVIDRLPLGPPASAALARGVELAARMALEQAVESTRWESLFERLSRKGTHGSWRRVVLLALVRSEIGPELLARVSGFLLADRAVVLRELIRLVMAVEVEPAAEQFAAYGVDPARVPPGLYVPSTPSWYRLILWLIELGDVVPTPAIPDVVDFYTAWSIGTLGRDPLTPRCLQQLYHWLTKIETASQSKTARDLRERFGGELGYDQIRSLESNLRTAFLSFCHRTPALAVEYLQSLRERQYSKDAVRGILKFHGSLAQVAPAELAELTTRALIPRDQPEDEWRQGRDYRQPFDYPDHEFWPASPSQGPFFELLCHAPQHGLPLIHRLVDHAISFCSHGQDYGTDAITISLPDGERVFPWQRSYAWPREGVDAYCVTSALMALEAWAHQRIEAEESFDKVLTDVLGPPGSPAAYLQVAVDLLLSHWPKSREAAVPFLACPELLCIDLQRHFHDNTEYPDLFGLKALQTEPPGAVSVESLKKRDSRRLRLDQFLGEYATSGPDELRERLAALLHDSAKRLGPPGEQSDLGDPTFMVVHALNLVDPNNWHEASVDLTDGTRGTGQEYVSPESESRHLAPLLEASQNRIANTNMQAALGLALENSSRSTPEFAASAVEWARNAEGLSNNDEADEVWMREEAIVSAATIAMRDGDAELRVQHARWARHVFIQALQAKEDSVHRFRSGLRYNPIAAAFTGMIHALKDSATPEDVRAVLEVAARDDPAAAYGLGAAASALASIDERLLRGMMRCAFTACVRPNRDWDLTEEEVAGRSDRNRQRIRAAVDAEAAWLADEGPEPDWPAFPSELVRPRRGIGIQLRFPGQRERQETPAPQHPRPLEYVDHQAAALWLKNAGGLVNEVWRPWIREVMQTYATWTATANGAGLDTHERVDNLPTKWNDAYFDLLANSLHGLTLPEIEQLALKPISSLPDQPFFDVVTRFLWCIDTVYFNDRGPQESIAIAIRSALADRLIASHGWNRLRGSRPDSVETHIGPAIAVFFFNDYGFARPPKCYLLAKGIDRIGPFVPVLEKMVQSAPSLFVALITLNLLEVSPRSAHLQFLVAAAKTWLASYPDDTRFWVDYSIGSRVCAWIKNVWQQESSLIDTGMVVRAGLDGLLSGLVSIGVAEARRLEELLAGG